MKRYWLLAWNQYYPYGELDNVHSRYNTREEAEVVKQKLKNEYDFVRIIDIENWVPEEEYNEASK